jgi:hypothetical protein
MSLALSTKLHSFDEPQEQPIDVSVRLETENTALIVRWSFVHTFPNQTGLGEMAEKLYLGNCFELFWGLPNGAYIEWNFSPDGRWSVYAFEAYREAIQVNATVHMPLHWHCQELEYCEARIKIPEASSKQLNITAITAEGSKFWASQHPPQRPDFHNQNFWLSFE